MKPAQIPGSNRIWDSNLNARAHRSLENRPMAGGNQLFLQCAATVGAVILLPVRYGREDVRFENIRLPRWS
jgi:hypothetical protein